MIAISLLAAALGGCWFGKDEPECELVQEYQEAQLAPQVSVPAGLDRPDVSTRLNIPEGPPPAEPLSKTAACLQRPPDYFDRPLTGPASAN